MYESGYTNIMAYDYSEIGIERARQIFGPKGVLVALIW